MYGIASCPYDVDKMKPIRDVQFKKATQNDWLFKAGTRFLQMKDYGRP
jgi:hypothetical protein